MRAEIAQATGMSQSLTEEYIDLVKNNGNIENNKFNENPLDANKFSAHVQPISAASNGVLRLNSTTYGRPQKVLGGLDPRIRKLNPPSIKKRSKPNGKHRVTV